MGFRFRKSFGKGPFRFNISKSGIGWSVGTKGARYTKKATGGTRTTLSVPGTGVSYVTESSKSKSKKESKKMGESKTPKSQKSKKPFWKRWWVWALIIVCLLGSCGQDKEAETEKITSPTIIVEEKTEESKTLETPKVEESESVEIPKVEEPVQTESSVIEIAPPTEEIKEPETTPPSSVEEETELAKTLVYTTPKGENYHKSTCRFVKNKDVTEWEIEDAIAAGYDQCGTCKPR